MGEEALVLVVGLVASAVAAVLNSAAGLLEAAGGRRAARGGPVLGQPLYVAGLGVDVLGFALTVLALRHLPVFAVQAVLAGAIPLTALAAHRLHGLPLGRVDRLAVGACVAGLAVVAASAGRSIGPPPPDAAAILLVGLAGLAVAAVPAWRGGGAVPCAVLAGLAFGGVALAVRAVHLQTSVVADLGTLPAEPAAYAVLGFAALGLAAYTRALTRGEVAVVTGVLVVTEAVVPGLVGLVVLGDTVRPGWAPACAAGLVLAVGGVVVLSRSIARDAAAAPARPRG